MIAERDAGAAGLEVHRDERGRLCALRAGEHTYLERDGDSVLLGDGLVRISELRLPRGLLRHVRAGRAQWVERFEWDVHGRPSHVDGVEVVRDREGRVVACGSDWRYRFGDGGLQSIAGPFGERQVARDASGRPLKAVAGLGLPPSHQRDALGRTWCVLGPDGEIATTYLWDGFACFGRIDGPPGEPLAAAFTLDPSHTPVRVIAADGTATRIPRDAFGEALLDQPGVPGLFGGVVYDGLVHTRARALDPRHGCWDRPDPWHGHPGDPRRAAGYEGPLPVEGPAGDEYTICRGDPVGRADPTGEVSWGLIVSDFFWSHPNNLLGIFGLDLTLNMWGALFAGRAKRWRSFERMSSTDAMGAFGLRRDGLTVYADKAWTYQHLVFAQEDKFENDACLFDPLGVWEPSLYATVLVIAPAGGRAGDPFVLRGSNHRTDTVPPESIPRAPGWTRVGGPAVPVASGSMVPRFTSGGLHLDAPREGIREGEATIVEAAAAGAPLEGMVDQATASHRFGIDVAVPPAAGDRLVLRTAGQVTRIGNVVDVEAHDLSPYLVVIELEPGDAPGPDPRLHATGGIGAAETLAPVDGSQRLLTLPEGSAVGYAAGDAVRLSQPSGSEAAPVGAAVIMALETRLELDAAPPAGWSGWVDVRQSAPHGPEHPATLSPDGSSLTVKKPADAPGPGAAILVSAAGSSLPALVAADGSLALDRALSGVPPGDVTWRAIARGRLLGGRDAPPDSSVAAISYVPAALRQIPVDGSVLWIEGSGVALRSVRSLVREAIELDHDLPGDRTADYSVHRMTIDAGTDAASLGTQLGLRLDADPGLLDCAAIEIVGLGAATVTDGPRMFDAELAGSTLTVSPPPTPPTPPPAAPPFVSLPYPGQVVVVLGGGVTAPAVVGAVRLNVTFDREIAAATTSRIVPLDVARPVLAAFSGGHPNLVVRPRTPAGHRLEQPRFVVGEAIRVTVGGDALLFRVRAVDGARLTVEGVVDPALPAGGQLPASGTACDVSRLVAEPPRSGRAGILSGAPFAAVNGNRRATGDGTSWTFDVWQPDALTASDVVGIDDGTTTQPARIASVDALVVELTAPPAGIPAAVPGPTIVALAQADVRQIAHATRFKQDGELIVVDESLLPAGDNRVLAIALVAQGEEHPGRLGTGGVLIPNNLEIELDKRAALVEHELRHTMQSAWWGPLLLGFFPLAALQAGFELGTDADLPAFTPYVHATLAEQGSKWLLTISQPDGYEEGSMIQLSASRVTHSAELPAPDAEGRFLLTLPLWAASGDVHVRRSTASKGSKAMRGITGGLQILTHGGMLNLLAGTVWGSLFMLVAHYWYAIGQIGDRTTHPATVEDDGRALRLDATTPDITAAAQIVIIAGDEHTVRAVDSVNGLLVRFAAPVHARGAVRVARFKGESPTSFWDWHDYFPASTPDPTRPASLKIEPVDGKVPQLHPHDRVQVRSDGGEFRTNVSAVSFSGDDELVELVQAPGVFGGATPGDLQIAKVGEVDPMGDWDSALLTKMGMGWMRWMFDPYGQVQLRAHAKPGGFGDVALRTMRYAMGTQSWSAVVPGYYFVDNAFKGKKTYKSQMEQDASSNSGNLYSMIARLQDKPTHVGDVGQYWAFEDNAGFVRPERGDAPGVWLQPRPRLVPNRLPEGPETPGAETLNKGSEAPESPDDTDLGPGPGDDVAGVFWRKGADPRDLVEGDLARRCPPADRGWVPTSPTMERAAGAYVAFTRPSRPGGQHRVTSQDFGTPIEKRAREVHDAFKLAGKPRATVLFDLEIDDVDVRVGGRVVEEGGTVELVVTERALVAVDPGGDRIYDVTVAAPPPALLTGAGMVIQAGSAPVAAAVDVEVARLHAFTDGAFATPALRSHPFNAEGEPPAVHLPADIHVPVRRFSVTVTTALPARNAMNLLAASRLDAALRPGQVCVLVVPAEVVAPPAAGPPAYPGIDAALAADMAAPAVEIVAEPLGPDLLAQIPSGAVFKVTMGIDEPPEARCELPIETVVGGATGDTATLLTTLMIEPHFTLELPDAAVDNTVARGPSGGVTLRCNGATPAPAVTIQPADGVSAEVAGNDIVIAVGAGAAKTARTITVTDAADVRRRARRTIVVV